MNSRTTPHEARSPVRARVDLDAIAANYVYLRDRVGPRRTVYCVVKADAYGHGAAAVARRLEREGAATFAVAQTEEGVALRRAGVAGEILLLSHSEPADLPRQRAYGLSPTLYDRAQIEEFARATRTATEPLRAHLELDTGMGRAGIRPAELGAVAAVLRDAPGLSLAGTFATLSAADDASSPETARQVAGLADGIERLRGAGVDPGRAHLANSAGILDHPSTWLDAVRPGLALYGIAPSGSRDESPLRPAMTVETRVVAVRRVPSGTALGYGGQFVTARDTAVAVLPIGYHDGLRRSVSGKTAVLLRGRRAPVVGSVSMDVTLVDATDTGAERGDRAVCLGSDGGGTVTAWDLARAAGTIPYEILCGIGPRVLREYSGIGS